jgi:triosephosphate isomerase
MSSPRRPFVAGNWKMHGSRTENAARVATILAHHTATRNMPGAARGNKDNARNHSAEDPARSPEIALFVPFPYMAEIAGALAGSGIALGAQDVSAHATGAFTGEVSAEMIRDVGCHYVLVGHSERRTLHGETNAIVTEKFCRVKEAGLIPVLCLGETLVEREAGQTADVICRQLDAVLEAEGASSLTGALLAYEPVWAIGTGQVATPAKAEAAHRLLRERVAAEDASVAAALRILYGGSIKADNAAALFARPDIDGGLIGGASLRADTFLAICQAAVF